MPVNYIQLCNLWVSGSRWGLRTTPHAVLADQVALDAVTECRVFMLAQARVEALGAWS